MTEPPKARPEACYGMTCPLRGTCERYDPLIQWRLTTAAGAMLAEQ